MRMTKPPFARLIAASLGLMVSAAAVAAEAPWDEKARCLPLSGLDANAWLTGGVARVVLADGQTSATSDKRYKVTVAENVGRWVVMGADANGVLDWETPAPRQSRPPARGVAAKSNFLSVVMRIGTSHY